MNKDRQWIKSQLNEVFCNIFDDDEIEIFEDMTADDIEEWDSLMHVTLMIAVEKEFNITMSAEQIGNLKSVSELIDIITM